VFLVDDKDRSLMVNPAVINIHDPRFMHENEAEKLLWSLDKERGAVAWKVENEVGDDYIDEVEWEKDPVPFEEE
jgi:hypothetical protein